MKEVDFETGYKKRADAFFDENPYEYGPLQSSPGGAGLSRTDDNPAARQNPLVGFLKQAFLFFPGTFFLFYISLGTTLTIRNILENPNRKMLLIYLIGLLAFLMTWFGLGDAANKRHLAIPASIILSGVVIGAFVKLTENVFWISRGIIDDFGYAVWLFPLALIVPFLAKGCVGRKTE